MGAECNAAPMRHLHRTSGSHTRTKLMTTCQDMSKLVRHAIQSVVAAILSPFEMHAYTPRRGCRADDAPPCRTTTLPLTLRSRVDTTASPLWKLWESLTPSLVSPRAKGISQ
eukprot:CAMPEP_0169179784 /NCGR_PEP_ID=MMETSP1015-20121227/67827_1 /TAXON_ID=342587 /ORGANISM="Karlodinium micrum, Strain CCMP2283" /LENGTH=111 /DNA_ID=CAMNT_0009254859 /DNA_START=385 /DNA_END=717 /DNA_ORIENTATION=-